MVSQAMQEYIEISERTILFGQGECKRLEDALRNSECKLVEFHEKVKDLEAKAERQEKGHCAQEEVSKIEDGKDEVERRERRKLKQNENYVNRAVCRALGVKELSRDSLLHRAAGGFLRGSQQQKQCIGGLKEEAAPIRLQRCGTTERKHLLLQMVTEMYDGDILRDIERSLLKKKRFSTVGLARESDMYSTFNIRAVGSIGKCEGGKQKGQRGLLCSESSLRRTLDLVHDQSVQLGYSFMPEQDRGKVWCWGDSGGLLVRGINMYVKAIYHDAFCDGITKDDPWLCVVTGDLARTSQRGAYVTVMGPKQADRRLANQERTGKTMCQSSTLYSPAVAGLLKEGELMPYFHAMIREFQNIERQGFCVVNGSEFEVNIRVVVVADLSFLHKYVQRGGSSHSATHFCMLCSAISCFRHEGYPGGCRKCRRLGIVYRADGLQKCGHHEACTPSFLRWQKERHAELCELVPAAPLTCLPVWENVNQLREECILRCVDEYACDLGAISKRSGAGTLRAEELTNWILKYCRGGCTLSNDLETGVMHCDIAIVKSGLAVRRVPVSDGKKDAQSLRLQMQGILQLELEYAKSKMYIRDDRFSPDHPSGAGIPLNRLIICILHCPMRTHEKILTLLLQNACHSRVAKKSRPLLDVIAGTIRRLGHLGDEWSVKMEEDNSSKVQKIKMHWDHSKHIFKTEHMSDLKKIIRLAIAPAQQGDWMLFMVQYVQCIDLMTVSRDYTDEDLSLLERYCDETWRLLISFCGGDAAVTNYFHYIGSGHVVWMCSMYGNLWRYRNEGVEAFNKILSRRYNMFNSQGNKGRKLKTEGGNQVQPFEVLGKWLGRYVMWQLEFANNLFIAEGCKLGPSEIAWDASAACFVDLPCEDNVVCDSGDDGDFSGGSGSSDSDSELEAYTCEDESLCAAVNSTISSVRGSRKRAYSK